MNQHIEADRKANNGGPPVIQTGSEHRGKQMTEIIVNARERSVPGNTVTFEQIVAIAFPENAPSPGQPFVYSMTYRRAASVPHAGELGPGGIVTVKKGTIFNVTRTVQS